MAISYEARQYGRFVSSTDLVAPTATSIIEDRWATQFFSPQTTTGGIMPTAQTQDSRKANVATGSNPHTGKGNDDGRRTVTMALDQLVSAAEESPTGRTTDVYIDVGGTRYHLEEIFYEGRIGQTRTTRSVIIEARVS